MERWLVKLVALLLIFIITEICTLLPIKVSVYFIRMGSKGEKIISYLMCFGGGVFLGLYMLHMGPDVRELLGKSLLQPYNITYPLAEFITALGFFLMLFVEKLVMKIQKNSSHKPVHNGEAANHDVTQPMVQHVTQLDGDIDMALNSKTGTTTTNQTHTQANMGQGHSHGHDLAGTRSLLLLLALSLHHVFEGMSVGLKHTNHAVWALTIAILSHEVVIAFCLGMQLVSAYSSTKKVVIAATMCSAMVPLGIVVGMLVVETGSGDESTGLDILNGTLQAISTGVFIYVTFFEILGGEINHDDTNMTKVAFILIGFLVLAALGLVPEGGEDTENSMFNQTVTVMP